jgi:hypothetical protein
MKIKQYIVTYNNSFQVNECINSIFKNLSQRELDVLEVYIINNHTNFNLDTDFSNKVTVLHNVLRADWSTGHLSRNWNQSIINGFGYISKPECDIVITCQDDTRFNPNYIDTVVSLHRKFDLIQFGWGDNFISYTIDAVKRIGLWDERFCSIGYQEADYLLRAFLYAKDKVSINDKSHRRVVNESSICPISIIPSGNLRGETYTKLAVANHAYNKKLFETKWGYNPDYGFPDIDIKSKIPSYILYPYFENEITTLIEQNYII